MKHFLQELTPPILLRAAYKLLNRIAPQKPIEWEYIPEGWAYAKTHHEVKGWNVQDILDKYKKKWPHFIEKAKGINSLGFVHESNLTTNSNIHDHNTIMTFAYALALAAQNLKTLSLLDWGGGIGHYALLSKALLPDIPIDYHCKDVPKLANYGAKLFPQYHFYTDDSCFARSYDFVMASTSIHYIENWQALFASLARVTSRYLYIANLPTVLQAPSFVFIQRPYTYGYNTEYLSWCLNQDEFLAYAEGTEVELVRMFTYGHRPIIHNAPEQNEYRGFLFRSTAMLSSTTLSTEGNIL